MTLYEKYIKSTKLLESIIFNEIFIDILPNLKKAGSFMFLHIVTF